MNLKAGEKPTGRGPITKSLPSSLRVGRSDYDRYRQMISYSNAKGTNNLSGDGFMKRDFINRAFYLCENKRAAILQDV